MLGLYSRSSGRSLCRPVLSAIPKSEARRCLFFTSAAWSGRSLRAIQRGPTENGPERFLPRVSGPSRSMATAFPVRREDIVKHIKGQTLRLPELEGLFNGWPRLINPHQAAVEDVTRDVIHKYTVSQKLLKKLEKIKLASLVTVFYPFASPERLTELVYFVCWMFILDDEIDTMTAAGRDSDAEFRRIWDECLRVIGESCGLHGQEPETGWRKSDFDSVESFRGIGRWLTARYTVEQRQRFWDETLRTAHSYSKEQKIRRAMGVPDYDDYCEYRYGSCCMGQAFTMVEYANESSLPAEVMDSPEVRALCVETARLLWINNDIISVKKEIADDFLENLVVIASKPKYHLQDGMDHCIEKLKQAVKAADQAASTLRAKYVTGRNDKVARELDKLITTCQSMSAGLFFWTRDSPRYGFLHEPRDADGTATFTVGEPPL